MVSLATLLGEHYAHLVNRDRPDLQDEEQGIGIEVTRAIRENKNVANALVNEMAGEDIKEVNAEDLQHINQSGYAYGLGDGSIIGRNEYEFWSLALPLKRILEIKMNKVNDGFYGDFDEFGLFVFTKEDLAKTDFIHGSSFHKSKLCSIATLKRVVIVSSRFQRSKGVRFTKKPSRFDDFRNTGSSCCLDNEQIGSA